MKSKPKVTIAQIKVALAMDLAKLHKKELDQITKAKTIGALFKTSAFECAMSKATNKLINTFEDQENA